MAEGSVDVLNSLVPIAQGFGLSGDNGRFAPSNGTSQGVGRADLENVVQAAADNRFDDLAELDAVRYVGRSALLKLLAYAEARGATTDPDPSTPADPDTAALALVNDPATTVALNKPCCTERLCSVFAAESGTVELVNHGKERRVIVGPVQ